MINNENPHYDDLVRELRELKQFIEDTGDRKTHPSPGNHDSKENLAGTSPGVSDANNKEEEESIPTPIAPVDQPISDDEPPRLNEVVHRPDGTGNGQLDLLAMTSEEIDSTDDTDADTNTEQHTRPSWTEPPEPLDDSTTPFVVSNASEEVTRFVYDLSDRVVNTLEDKLTERSGEILPDDLREEIKNAVAEILYEWCEQ